MTANTLESTSTKRLISATRLFDGAGNVLVNGGVIIHGNRIEAVGERSALLQATPDEPPLAEHFEGCTLLPGLIDAHTHLIMPGNGAQIMDWANVPDETLLFVAASNAWTSLQAGVTTLADFGAKDSLAFRLRDAMDAGVIVGSRLILCGRALTITGGHGWPWGGEADGIEGVRKAVRDLCKEGADFIKVMVTGGGTPGTDGRRPAYSLPELQAIVEEAHRHNRSVFGHCTAVPGIELALDAGFDLIVHCQYLTLNGEVHFDQSLAQRLLEQNVYVNPTLQINRILQSDRVTFNNMTPERRTLLEKWRSYYPQFKQAFLRMTEMGIPMVCGSDCGWGYLPFDETYLELVAMVDAGMSPSDALNTATGIAADALGWGDRIGRLQPGNIADLLVVHGDPTQNMLALANVRQVWRDGQPLSTLSPYANLEKMLL